MATSSSSLVVKISADITDFSKQLDKATRTVDQAAKKIAGFGTALTVGITLPVLGAAAALAKMAAENEDTAGRMERVFGSAASSVNASIQTMMKSVPEANTELQKMAISVDNMAQGLGIAPSNAAKMSESLLKLAGDAAAFAHVPMEQALDALSRGLAGKTKGLLEFGIAISEADIKAKALSMGLVHQGNDLTETGTALASYALIMERSSRIQGEAERTAGQMGKQFQFLKRDLGELADNVSGLVLPALSDLAKKARDIVSVFAGLDQSSVKTFFKIAAGAAALGPVIFGFAKLIDLGFKLKTAFGLLAAGESAGFFATLAALPFSSIIAGILAIAGAVAALTYEWQKLKQATPETRNRLAGIAETVAGGLTNETIGKAVGGFIRGAGEKTGPVTFHTAPPLSGSDLQSLLAPGNNAPTERAPIVDPLKAMEERAKLLTDAFKHMGDGWQIPDLTDKWVRLLIAAQAQYDGIKDKTTDIANRLREIISSISDAAAKATNSASDLATIANLTPASAGALPVTAAQSGVQISPQVAQLGNQFSAMALGAAQFQQSLDDAASATAYEFGFVRSNLEQFGIHLGELGPKMQSFVVSLTNGLMGFAQQAAQLLTANIGGSGKSAGFFRGLGGFVGGAAGFAALAGFGPIGMAAGAFLGATGGSAIGGLFGGLFDHHKKAAEASATSLDTLARTVDRVTASITNIPAFFKVQNYRFEAAPTLTYTPPTVPPPSTIPPGTTIPGSPIPQTPGGPDPNDPKGGSKGNLIVQGDIHVYGVTDVKSFMQELSYQNLKNRSTGNASRLAFAGFSG